MKLSKRHPRRRGFTLVELVIVILLLGIIAAIAAPKMFDTATDARTNSTRQSLAVLRTAIELYRAQNGVLPGDAGTEADFKTDMQTVLNGAFPRAEVGNSGVTVRVQTTGSAITASGTEAWAYDSTTGEIVVNHASYISW